MCQMMADRDAMEAPSHSRSEVQSAIQEHLAEQREALAALDDALADGSSDDLLEARTHRVARTSHWLPLATSNACHASGLPLCH